MHKVQRDCVVWVLRDEGFEEGHRAWLGFCIVISVILTEGICWQLWVTKDSPGWSVAGTPHSPRPQEAQPKSYHKSSQVQSVILAVAAGCLL